MNKTCSAEHTACNVVDRAIVLVLNFWENEGFFVPFSCKLGEKCKGIGYAPRGRDYESMSGPYSALKQDRIRSRSLLVYRVLIVAMAVDVSAKDARENSNGSCEVPYV